MNFNHPAFIPYRPLIDALGLDRGLPQIDALNRLAGSLDIRNARGLPVRFFEPAGKLAARAYETHILDSGQVPTRADTWHDVLNALVWLRFPRFKAALNAAHGVAIGQETDPVRGRRRDALTVLDESGVWVISRSPALPRLLQERAWETLFWTRRSELERDTGFVVVGHALLEKLLSPYPSITGKCLVLVSDQVAVARVEVNDEIEAQAILALQDVETPRVLPPLPVQGVPGWDPANACAEYYANRDVFRPPAAHPA